MAHLPYRPEQINDADANELGLTLEQVGAFVKLKRAVWRNNGWLPNDAVILAALSGAGRKWPRIAQALRRKLIVKEGRIFIEEITTMLQLAIERRAKAVTAGRQSGLARTNFRVAKFAHAKSLKNNETALNQVGPEFNNHNQTHIQAKTQRPADAAAVRQSSGTFCEVGARILVERVNMRSLAAQHQIARWLSAVDGDEAELNAILRAAAAENLRGPHFVAVIDQRIASRNRELKKGLPLPFPPGLVINGGK